MDQNDLKKIIESVDYNDLKLLKKLATKKVSSVRNRDRMFFRVYLQKEYVEKFERTLDWAFSHGVIKRRSRWAFAKFAIVNVMDMIEEEMRKEQIERDDAELALRALNPNPFHVSGVKQDKAIL